MKAVKDGKKKRCQWPSRQLGRSSITGVLRMFFPLLSQWELQANL